MNESNDRMLADWLRGGPENGPREGLERALAVTRRVRQRPGWTLLERWIPMQVTMAWTRSQRPILALVMLALLMVALVATALVIGSLWHQTPSLYRNGAVVYELDGDLFIADRLDGTAWPLVAGPETDSGPVFSPQGDRVAFVRSGPDGARIMAVRPDGSNVTELATVPGLDKRLGWSPDGRTLLAGYFSRQGGRQTDFMASDGSGSRRLHVPGHVLEAAWRPDGRLILLRRMVDPDDHLGYTAQGVYIADANGTNISELPIGDAFQLAWSPDGKHFSFLSQDGDGGRQVNIADIDEAGTLTGARKLKLETESSEVYDPQWSPDGSKVAFKLDEGTREYVGVIDSDSSNFRIVAPKGSEPGSLVTWSPDGRSLAIAERLSDQDGNDNGWGKVWSVDVATGKQTEVRTPVESWQRLAP